MEQPKRVIDAVNLVKYYPITQGIIFKKQVGTVHAVDGITIWLDKGETLAIVGESGCGKSTAGRLLLGLERPTEGTISVLGDDITEMSEKDLRTKRRDIQIILQDPYTSLNPRMTVGSIIGEPFDIHPEVLNGRTKAEAVRALMDKVGLDPEFISRYPHQFSGGQRQRIGVARALALNPDIIVADEPVSALDPALALQTVQVLCSDAAARAATLVASLHAVDLARSCFSRIVGMREGRIVFDLPVAAVDDALLSELYATEGGGLPLLAGEPPGTAPPTLAAGLPPRATCWR